jgi:hypothetical protein
MPDDKTTAMRGSAEREAAGRDAAGRESAGQASGGRQATGREGAGQESTGRARSAEAGAERPQTYAVPPRSLEDVAAEQEAGSRSTGAGAGHQLRVAKDELTWMHGIHHIKNAHGPELTERARELVRRALGELYQEAQGAEPASPLAHEVCDALSDTGKLNELGDAQHNAEHRGLNQRGQALYG